ncbi:hypothetical protein DW219_11245 [Desulfovibrio sp. AM18-2]|jgi:hypothetical protein|nr:hypothetical protein DW219_11245 [Desulfovibrio sp. AM18-2]
MRIRKNKRNAAAGFGAQPSNDGASWRGRARAVAEGSACLKYSGRNKGISSDVFADHATLQDRFFLPFSWYNY